MEKITSIRVKENTKYKLNKIKLEEKFKSIDELILFLLSLKTNKTIVKQTETFK